ncbi:MAG: hypothetical protein IIY38_07340 [Clostridia bacterium]|nr:hypothetical protein [Clostridia bacterium]
MDSIVDINNINLFFDWFPLIQNRFQISDVFIKLIQATFQIFLQREIHFGRLTKDFDRFFRHRVSGSGRIFDFKIQIRNGETSPIDGTRRKTGCQFN